MGIHYTVSIMQLLYSIRPIVRAHVSSSVMRLECNLQIVHREASNYSHNSYLQKCNQAVSLKKLKIYTLGLNINDEINIGNR